LFNKSDYNYYFCSEKSYCYISEDS